MKQSTIDLHTHEKANCNTTHSNAWAIAEQVSRWSLANLVYLVRPPEVEGVVIMPTDPSQVDDSEAFNADMFKAGGFLKEEPLNHYLRLKVAGLPAPLMVNAAFLIDNYLWGTRQGVAVLKRLIERAKEKYWSQHQTATVTTTAV